MSKETQELKKVYLKAKQDGLHEEIADNEMKMSAHYGGHLDTIIIEKEHWRKKAGKLEEENVLLKAKLAAVQKIVGIKEEVGGVEEEEEEGTTFIAEL